MFKRDFSKKKIYFYALTKKNDPEKKFYTLTSSIKDAYEYLNHLLQVEHFEHFKSWSELKNLDINDEKTWILYLNNCIDVEELEHYTISKVLYTNAAVASMLRTFASCIPLNCSFEHPSEMKKYLQKIEIEAQMLDAIKKAEAKGTTQTDREVKESADIQKQAEEIKKNIDAYMKSIEDEEVPPDEFE